MNRLGSSKTHLLGEGALLVVSGRLKIGIAVPSALRLLSTAGIGPGVYLRLAGLWRPGPVLVHAGQSVNPVKRQRHYVAADADVVLAVSAGADQDIALDTLELLTLEYWLCASGIAASRLAPDLIRCDNKVDRDGSASPKAAREQREPVLAALLQLPLMQLHPALCPFLDSATQLLDVTAGDVNSRLPQMTPAADSVRARSDLQTILRSGLVPAGTILLASANGSDVRLVLTSDGGLHDEASRMTYDSPSSVLTALIRRSGASSTRRNGWQRVTIGPGQPFAGRTLHWARAVARAIELIHRPEGPRIELEHAA